MKSLLSAALFFSFTYLNAGVELDYLNSLRAKTGLPAFGIQSNLTAAAQNHSAYMQTNNISGHYEERTKSGYTGDAPWNRTVYAGYQYFYVSENVSYGSNATYQSSIDGLFSAIYHRFGFLTLSLDEVGIGISNSKQFYTYDMGNSRLNSLCAGASYVGTESYYLPCADTSKKVSASSFEAADDAIKATAPDLVLWPAENSNDIPPVFYEESPDPLPSHSVTGYPISVQFNDEKISAAPTVSSFTLSDASGKQLNTLISMNKSNDPNQRFSAYQYALFPEKRLEWGSEYIAEIIYNINGVQQTKNWHFTTRSLANKAAKFYRIENTKEISLNIVAGTTYAIYVVPNDTNDQIGGVSYSYTGNALDFDYIDANTLLVSMTGISGNDAIFTFSNGQKITLTIANSDTAVVPSTDTLVMDATASSSSVTDTDQDGIPDTLDTDDDNDGISDSDELANGLNPLNTSDAQADFDNDGFSNAIEISVGSDMRDTNEKPVWAPVMMDNIVIMVPSFS